MSTPDEKLQADVDRLYALPLDQFTPARDELARRLRSDGDRDASTEVKGLRKPNLLAWALNQARHRDPERVDELIAAGERLQKAQDQLVAGGERGLLRDAAADERRLVEEVAAMAARELDGAAHPVNPTVQSKLWSTAHAAAVSPEPRDLLRAGRLLRDYEVSDLGLMGAGPAVVAPASPARGSAKTREPAGTAKTRSSAGTVQARESRGARAPTAPTPRKAAATGAAKREAPDRAAERKATERETAERDAAEAAEAAEAEEAAEAAERKAAERQARGIRRELERARSRQHKLAGKLTDARARAAEAKRQAARAASEFDRAESSLEQAGANAAAAAARVSELETELSELER